MGTRGLKVVRFRGRYFVYWNQFDSYPEVLGQMLVNEIPENPNEYKVWLERERAVYGQMIADLEKILIVTDEKIALDLKRGVSPVTGIPLQATPPMYTAGEEALRPYDIVDDRLESFPNYFTTQGVNLWIEWVYTIDLDREILFVTSQEDSTQFRMDNIPRKNLIHIMEKGCELAVEDDEEKDRKDGNDEGDEKETGKEGHDEKEEGEEEVDKERLVDSSKFYSKAVHVDLGQSYLDSRKSRDNYEAIYQTYNSSFVRAKSQIDRSSRNSDIQILSLVLFEKLVSPSILYLNIDLPRWSTEDIAFKEMAFAILSFAAGQYRMTELQDLSGVASNGYFVHRDGEKQEVLPVFGSGCRRSGLEPNSSPPGTVYWFENVLVSLVSHAVIHRHAEVAIAEVVEFGLATGSDDFYSIVFSLADAIMLHVTVEKGVKTVTRTELTKIVDYEGPIREVDSLDTLCETKAGFISLVNFFNAAAVRYVTPFNRGCFPTEIYSKIHSYIDDGITYTSIAKCSTILRSIDPGMMMFGRNLKTPKFCPDRRSKRNEWVFTFEDVGSKYVMKIMPYKERKPTITKAYWSPVVGSKRPCIISVVEISFETETVQDKKSNRSWPSGWFGPFNSNAYTVKVNWEDSVLDTARQVQELWAYYLQSIFQGDEYRSEFYTSPYNFDCTLIPHYREFSIMYGKGYIWICIRRSVDGDTPLKKAATLDYVTARLNISSQKKVPGHGMVQDGEFVLVAFGVQANFFRWRATGEDGAGSLVPYIHFDDCSKEEVRLKMESEMLIPLIKRIVERAEVISLPDRTGSPTS